MKLAIVICLFLALLTGCATAWDPVRINPKQLTLNVEGKELTKPLYGGSLHYYPGFCVHEAFTLNSQDIFLEKIRLDANCSWNGLPRGFFVSLFKDKLKLTSLKMIENTPFEKYELSVFKVNGSAYVSLIHHYGVFNDLFIWDFEGSLYEKLRHTLTQKPLRKKLQPRFKPNYNHALARYNFFHGYYGRMSERKWNK